MTTNVDEPPVVQRKLPLFTRLFPALCFAIVTASWFSSLFGVRGFLPDYAGDLFGALMLYAAFRTIRWPWFGSLFSPGFTAVFVFAGCTAVEFAQRRHWW